MRTVMRNRGAPFMMPIGRRARSSSVAQWCSSVSSEVLCVVGARNLALAVGQQRV